RHGGRSFDLVGDGGAGELVALYLVQELLHREGEAALALLRGPAQVRLADAELLQIVATAHGADLVGARRRIYARAARCRADRYLASLSRLEQRIAHEGAGNLGVVQVDLVAGRHR